MRLTYLLTGCFIVLSTHTFSQTLPLGQPISTALTDDFNPSVSGNGKTLVFEQVYPNAEKADVMISTQANNVWGRPEVVGGANTNIGQIENAGYFINHGGNMILFHSSRYGGIGGTDIWYVEKNASGAWTAPKNFAKPINTTGSEIDPSMSPDGKYLFFTLLNDKKTPAGLPCGKIMIAERVGKEGWKNPVALPSPINGECECGGTLLSDNKTFLFSSMRKGGKGGYDVYKTTLEDDGSSSEPVPYEFINTDHDDKYVSVAAGGSMIYYASLGKGTTKRDIFRSKIPDNLQPETVRLYQGKVYNSKTNEILAAQITVTNIRTGSQKMYATTADGNFSVPVSRTDDYDIGIVATTPGFTYISFISSASVDKKYEEKNSAFKLAPLNAGTIIPLTNLSFENNGIETDRKGELELNRMKILMRLNPSLKIEVRAYTDAIKTDTVQHSKLDKETPVQQSDTAWVLSMLYSDDHTEQQANYIADAITKAAVARDRISTKGCGIDEKLQPADRKKRYEVIVK